MTDTTDNATSPVDGLPLELASVDFGEGTVSLAVDAAIYPLEALYGAAYVFIDRCFVLLDQPTAGQFRVTLATKKGPATAESLRELVGEFANELLSCAWRHQITRDNRAIIESVALQAIGGAMGPPSLDDLASFDFTEEPFEDPLGIAMSWEEKYKKKDKAEPGVEDAAAPEAGSAAAGATGTGS